MLFRYFFLYLVVFLLSSCSSNLRTYDGHDGESKEGERTKSSSSPLDPKMMKNWKREIKSFYDSSPTLNIAPYIVAITSIEDSVLSGDCKAASIPELDKLLSLNPSSLVANYLLGECSENSSAPRFRQNAFEIYQTLASVKKGLSPERAIEIREVLEAPLILSFMGVDFYDIELIEHKDFFLYKLHTFNPHSKKMEHRYFSNKKLFSDFGLNDISVLDEEEDYNSLPLVLYFSQIYPFLDKLFARNFLAQGEYAAVINILESNSKESSISSSLLAEAYMKNDDWDNARNTMVEVELFADYGFDEALLTQAEYIINVFGKAEGIVRIYEILGQIDRYAIQTNALERLVKRLVGYEHHRTLLDSLYAHSDDPYIPRLVTKISREMHTANQHDIETSLLKFSAEKGDNQALFYLAMSYRDGHSVEMNLSRAIELFEASSQAGFSKADCYLGLLYRDYDSIFDLDKALEHLEIASSAETGGCEFELAYTYDELVGDYEKAGYLYKVASANGDGAATNNLGLMYESGRGVSKDVEKAISLYLEAIKQGDSSGHVNLGRLYESGIDVEQDFSKAFSHYSKGVELKNDQAMHNLASMYLAGNYVEKNRHKANELFKRAALKGNQFSLFNLGNAYRYGRGEDIDINKALFNYKGSAEFGQARAFCELGEMYRDYPNIKNMELSERYFLEGAKAGVQKCQRELGYLYKNHFEKHEESVKWLKVAAAQGDVDANYSLGLAYDFGYGVEVDVYRAIDYYEQATKLGSDISPANLGYIYETGKHGTTINNRKALHYYEISAKRNNPQGMNNLATFYRYGIEVQQDLRKAFVLYTNSAKANNEFALNNLANMYLNAEGVQQDYGKAFELFERSSSLNFPDAIHSIGAMYFHGLGVEKNYSKAVEYLTRSSDLGNSSSSNELALIFSDEEFSGKDFQRAIQYFTLSYEQGSQEAPFNLALLYQRGVTLREDIPLAIQWFKKAFAAGNKKAADVLSEMYWYGNGVEKNEELAIYWIQRLAESQGYNSESFIGEHFFYGVNVEQSYERARHYFELAALEKDDIALNNLGEIYRFGLGIEKDQESAMIYYLESAAAGSIIAMYNLGEIYKEGQGVNKSNQQALEWFEKSAEGGYVEAMYAVSKLYMKGEAIQTEMSEANRWLLRAAQSGHVEAMFDIAKGVLEQENELTSRQQALKFLKDSAENGYEPAIEYLNDEVEYHN
ncbi:SEL1-like repeat protein [Lacimicrobium alkaliphilum]|uniref:SEL1-like repeat protein n=1 Tax=Lacimicrobium alkaliphilum TaxID=1526571 RepID=UPI0009EC28A8|nr:SEL1-like repeat protein [Lacimicrobium alkaliphilum]